MLQRPPRRERIRALANGLPGPLPVDPQEYEHWYPRVMQHRASVMWETLQPGPAGEAARAREITRCKRSFIYEANTYGGIFEARDLVAGEWKGDTDWFVETGVEGEETTDPLPQGVLIPYIMYPFQIEVAVWIDDCMSSRGAEADGLCPKARDMGLSN